MSNALHHMVHEIVQHEVQKRSEPMRAVADPVINRRSAMTNRYPTTPELNEAYRVINTQSMDLNTLIACRDLMRAIYDAGQNHANADGATTDDYLREFTNDLTAYIGHGEVIQ